ncbi:hypothetical protein V7111_01350 [Neobacillus niacini]|uniref:hypothetical protein n=1 Tax=Neobacillus niacini TaxID=86668 RepID=UPI002FFF3F80
MRKLVSPEQHIEFFLSLVEKDIDHFNVQTEKVNEWMHMSILSLNPTESSYFKQLHDEYKQKAFEQTLTLKELQKTLLIYQIMRREA